MTETTTQMTKTVTTLRWTARLIAGGISVTAWLTDNPSMQQIAPEKRPGTKVLITTLRKSAGPMEVATLSRNPIVPPVLTPAMTPNTYPLTRQTAMKITVRQKTQNEVAMTRGTSR